MEKVYGTYKPPRNPYALMLAGALLLLCILALSDVFNLIETSVSIFIVLLLIIFGAFSFYKYFSYSEGWIKQNVSCPLCKGRISKVSAYGGGKHSRIRGFILHCENCDKDFALASSPDGYVLQDMNPTLMAVERIAFLAQEVIGLLAFFLFFCILAGMLLLYLFIETAFHINMFTGESQIPPIQKTNLTIAEENLCKSMGGEVLERGCCNQTIHNFQDTCNITADILDVCACHLFAPETETNIEYCYCGVGRCWNADTNSCINTPPSSKSH